MKITHNFASFFSKNALSLAKDGLYFNNLEEAINSASEKEKKYSFNFPDELNIGYIVKNSKVYPNYSYLQSSLPFGRLSQKIPDILRTAEKTIDFATYRKTVYFLRIKESITNKIKFNPSYEIKIL